MQKTTEPVNFSAIKISACDIIRLLIISIAVGIICGAVGAVFHHAIAAASGLFSKSMYMVFLLPICGIIITFLYKLLGIYPDPGTNAVLKSSFDGKPVSGKMSIAIFISTVLTQLSGGSAGREGAALQLGGSLAGFIGRKIHLSPAQMRIIILCGMSSLFSALFGTPVTAAVFCLEVVCIGIIPYAALVPCLVSAFTAKWISMATGMVPTAWDLGALPASTVSLYIKIIIIAVLCALVSRLFCAVQHNIHHAFEKIKNPYFRVLAGSGILILLTFLLGTSRYNGAGMGAVNDALLLGKATYLSFFIKMIFTGITLACGFKGGEIVPCFFVGSTFGCVIGTLLGIDPCFAAAIGMVCVFCGVVNSPLSSIALAVEAFGGGILMFAALPVGICYLLSGKCSLYSTQILPESKTFIKIEDSEQ